MEKEIELLTKVNRAIADLLADLMEVTETGSLTDGEYDSLVQSYNEIANAQKDIKTVIDGIQSGGE